MTIDIIADVITSILYESSVSAIMSTSGTLVFSSISEFKITDASHCVKLLLGLFDCSFPISSTFDDELYTITAPASPLVSFGNVLYLQSLQGSAVRSRVDRNYYSAPVIYRLNTFMKAGLPIISNKKQDKVITNVDATNQIKITLVDFKFEKVTLKSPLFICIKIKPVR